MNKKIFESLNELGIPCQIKGRDYLESAIEYAYNKGVVGITTELYPALAKKFNTTRSRVERGIRFAIEESFVKCPPDTLAKYFGNTIDYESGKLTNAAFIYGIAKYLKVIEDK